MPVRPYPDDREENATQLTLAEFVHRSNVLYNEMQDDSLSEEDYLSASKNFFRFVLAGRDSQNGISKHITLNACQALVNPVGFEVTRDYDSLIGVTHNLPYSCHLSLFPVPPFKDVLRKPNHIKAIAYRADRQILVPMCSIPNFGFAKLGLRGVVRVFFPCMYQRNDLSEITQEDFKLIYDQCLRPLIIDLMPNSATHWPISYSAALTLYRDNKGRIHPGSLDIPSHLLSTFADRYLAKLATIRPHFHDAYFMHELRGWKGATIHDPMNLEDSTRALSDMTKYLRLDRINHSRWQLDVALEFGHPGHVVTWRSSAHAALLAHCLPSFDQDKIVSVMKRSSFEVDRMMHTQDFAGFRLPLHPRGHDDNIHYLQAYTTEKTMAYQLHHGLFSNREAKQVLSRPSLENLASSIDRMSTLIYDCTGDNLDNDPPLPPQDGCARIEVRVPLEHALDVLRNPGIPIHLLRQSLAVIPSRHWWYFKWFRLAGIYAIIKNFTNSSSIHRQSDCALALAAIMIWILNGLYHRTENHFIALAKEACQRVPTNYDLYDPDQEDYLDDDDPAFAPVMFSAGLYFICDIVVDDSGTYRLPFHKYFTEDAILKAFRTNLPEIRTIMGIGDTLPLTRRRGNVERSNNRTARRTVAADNIRPQDRQLPEINIINLEDIPIRPSNAARMAGDDVDHFHNHGGGNRNQQPEALHGEDDDLHRTIQKLFEQFYIDIIEESPNKKAASDGSWTNIPKELRPQEATEQLFMDVALPFSQLQYTICGQPYWEIHFDRFFPAVTPQTVMQNFRKCSYYVKWHQLRSRLSAQSITRVRKILWSKFNTLAWVPYTQSDRMWTTRSNMGRNWKTLPLGRPHAGPQIAIHSDIYQRRLGSPHIRPPPGPMANPAEQQQPQDQNQQRQQRNSPLLLDEEEDDSDDLYD